MKKKRSLRDLRHTLNVLNVHISMVSEGEEKEKVPDKIFDEIIAKHFLNRNGMDLAVAEDTKR